ncbi:hypothetical protein MTR_7g056110 [Medicago truncatula]|uniref:Uncharacterized protein n=1 Tax=Medicago truncatula TaxID=3880 RepID=A0A072U9U7_MEDTR|nr:hypothetical protein MTR_7g056110 [Medicago truncatula]
MVRAKWEMHHKNDEVALTTPPSIGNYKNAPFRGKMKQIFERWSLGAKERIIGADSCQKYEDLIQKYLVQRFMSKI